MSGAPARRVTDSASHVRPVVSIIGPTDDASDRLTQLLEQGGEQARHYSRAGEVKKDAQGVYIFNWVRTPSRSWREELRYLHRTTPELPVIVAWSRHGKKEIAEAMEAGADEFIWSDELAASSALVLRRIQGLISERLARIMKLQASHSPRRAEVRADPVTSDWVKAGAVLSEKQRSAAREQLASYVARVPSASERTEPLADVLGIAVPGLRAKTGRLDAEKIAARIGLSVARIAKITNVSRQAISQTPDSEKIQSKLDPIARALAILDDLLPPDQIKQWLNSPQERLANKSPLQAIEAGRAESVARLLESAREGDVD